MRNRVEEIFHEIADLTSEGRVQYFDEHAIDAQTRHEVEALIQFDSPDSISLDRHISTVAEGALATLDPKNSLCGRYRLGELLGRGGMGTVYLGERVDGEVAQRVAVKLLRPGADDPRLRARFLAERQILAKLSHPNIARLLDAGHREDGQPYLVMEYVEGKAIDAYARGLGLRHKISLFLKVCAAVGYLHRNLVVHRDLKPPNILVSGEGEPKLLDFGIAKILDLTADSTVTGLRMLTPAYASPEQIAGEPVTTASDIYSLGAVLYKLLTDETPHRIDDESVSAITSVIAKDIQPPSQLVPALKGDLEAIVMKALRREPEERYGSVEQFAGDLENFLESRPIRARKGDAWYRTRKFLRRYWLPAAAASLAVAGLAAGLAVANRERRIAERRFEDVRQLANKLFDIDVEAREFSGSTKTRQLIVDTALEYLRRLSPDAQTDPELAFDIGNAYMRVARVQGVPVSQNLGQMDQAEKNLEIAERLMQSASAAQPGNRTALLRLAQIAHDRMLLARFNGPPADALSFARKSAELLERFKAGEGDKSEASAILVTYLNVADQHSISGQPEDALRICRRGTELSRLFNSPRYVGTFFWVSGRVYRERGDLNKALEDLNQSVAALSEGAGKTDRGPTSNYILALVYQARVLGEDQSISFGRSDEAVAVLDRAFQIADGFAHTDPNDQMARGRLAMAGTTMAAILRHSDPRRSLEMYEHVMRHMTEIKDNASFRRFEATALAGSTYDLRKLGRNAEVKARLDGAFERLSQAKSYPAEKIKPRSELDTALSARADYEAERGNVEAAIGTYEELTKKILAWGLHPDSHLADAVERSRLYSALAPLYRRAGKPGPAAAIEAQRLELWRRWDAKLANNSFVKSQLKAAKGDGVSDRPGGGGAISLKEGNF